MHLEFIYRKNFLNLDLFLHLLEIDLMDMTNKDFNRIYERNYRRSFLFAKSYVHDDLVAEDIAAESLFKYWQICKDSEGEVSEAMLVTILKNKAIDYLRAEMRKQLVLEDMAETAMRNLEIQVTALNACDPDELFTEEIQRIVQDVLKTLPEKTREIFLLGRYENKTVKEIALQVNLSPKTIEYHISQSLKALRIALKDYLPLWLIWFYWYQN